MQLGLSLGVGAGGSPSSPPPPPPPVQPTGALRVGPATGQLSDAGFTLPNGGNSWTAGLWVKPEDDGSGNIAAGTIIEKANIFNLAADPTGAVIFTPYDGGSVAYGPITAAGVLALGAWTFIAFGVDSGGIAYLSTNGAAFTTLDGGGANGPTTDPGGVLLSSNWTGLLDSLWVSALSPTGGVSPSTEYASGVGRTLAQMAGGVMTHGGFYWPFDALDAPWYDQIQGVAIAAGTNELSTDNGHIEEAPTNFDPVGVSGMSLCLTPGRVWSSAVVGATQQNWWGRNPGTPVFTQNTIANRPTLQADYVTFDGVNDSMTSPDLGSIGGDWGLSAWVYRTANTLGTVICKNGGGEWKFYWTGTRYALDVQTDAALRTITANSYGAGPTGQWDHIIAWRDSGLETLNIQVNGGAVDTLAITGETPSTTAGGLRVGSIGASQFFAGRLGTVTIFASVPDPTLRARFLARGRT
jgi:hypothetical protein